MKHVGIPCSTRYLDHYHQRVSSCDSTRDCKLAVFQALNLGLLTLFFLKSLRTQVWAFLQKKGKNLQLGVGFSRKCGVVFLQILMLAKIRSIFTNSPHLCVYREYAFSHDVTGTGHHIMFHYSHRHCSSPSRLQVAWVLVWHSASRLWLGDYSKGQPSHFQFISANTF